MLRGPFKYWISKAFLILAGFLISTSVFAQVDSDAVTSRRQKLEQDLAALEKQIEAQQVILSGKQRERVSLERDVAIIDANIEKTKLSIKALNLTITGLTEDIAGKEKTINVLSDKLARERQSLSQIIRKTNEIDSFSVAEVVLSGENVSSFFSDLDSFDAIQASLRDSYAMVVGHRTKTQTEKVSLEDKMQDQVELKKVQVLAQGRLVAQEKEKQVILKASKGVEAVYQQMIAANQKNAAAIRTELFTLRGSAAIPFEKAFEYAMQVSKKTGVRAAVILGIIAEESNLGENVGTGNWRVDMASPRDTVPFRDITSRLGLDPDKMPVSKKPWYGYGGAMGPAQFIPSTWILYEDRIADATGHRPPNPWDPQDAFMATGLLMADNGATAGTRAAERLAALRYLAGWKNATKAAYAFYGDDVMRLADKYQSQINILQAN